VCELVFLVITVLQGDEDSQVVSASDDTHARPGKLCAQLIVASCTDAFLRAINIKGRNRGVVRCLLSEVGDGHSLGIAFGAAGSARGCRGGRLESGVGVFNLPVTLQELAGSFVRSHLSHVL
jgi:hypothetical protein